MKRLATKLFGRLLVADLLSAGLSGVVLLWRGHVENGHAAAPINAVSHWVWPREAIRQDRASVRFTLTGAMVHFTAALVWCGAFEYLRSRRRAVNPSGSVGDAVAVSTVAAAVDLACVPDRLTPGFEKRLSPFGLVLVYGAFAAGLALAEMATRRR